VVAEAAAAAWCCRPTVRCGLARTPPGNQKLRLFPGHDSYTWLFLLL